jgi:protein-histidine pros-kinase
VGLLLKLNAILVTVFVLALVAVAHKSHELLEQNAREQVLENARLMLQTARSMRTYTSTQVAPILNKKATKTEFLPQTVPAYSAMEIFNSLREKYPDYGYKEATLNPTNPRDRVVEWESDVVTAFRNDTKKEELIGERDTPQGRFLFLGEPIKVTASSCLKCHSTPDAAPPAMLKMYGKANGFGWKEDEIIGAHLVSVPMAVAQREADIAFRTLFTSFVGVFVVFLIVLNILLSLIVVRPIRLLSKIADEVSMGNLDAPPFVIKGSDEVAVLAGSFSRMRISLEKSLKMLEDLGG